MPQGVREFESHPLRKLGQILLDFFAFYGSLRFMQGNNANDSSILLNKQELGRFCQYYDAGIRMILSMCGDKWHYSDGLRSKTFINEEELAKETVRRVVDTLCEKALQTYDFDAAYRIGLQMLEKDEPRLAKLAEKLKKVLTKKREKLAQKANKDNLTHFPLHITIDCHGSWRANLIKE